MVVRPFDEIFRDFVTDGVPSSGIHHPHKADIRNSLNAIVRGAFPDNRVIKLNNANEGTANEIVVSASVDIPTAVYQVLYVLNVTQENTGPVTISGAINRKLVTNTSEPVPAGYLKPGMAVLCIDTGSELRMLSYGDVESSVEDLVRRAEATEAAAELSKDLAQNAASDAVSQGNVPIYSTRNAVETLEIPAGINAIRTNGFATVGDGGGAMYKRVASEPSHAGKVQSADGAWWEIAELEINVLSLGAKPDSTGSGNGTDNSPIFTNCIDVAVKQGKNIYIPAGRYRLLTRVTYDKSAISGDSTFVPSIRGDGVTMTRIYCDASGLYFLGSLTAGFYASWIEISDLSIYGNGLIGTGLGVENQGFLRIERVNCTGFEYGIVLKGVISSKIEQPYLSYNRIGLLALPDDDDLWPPNALTIDQPWIANNTRAGIILEKPATFNIRGGSVEGNGTDTTINFNQRGGIFVNSPGLGGHAAIISDGVYYEYNSGIADVLFYETSREVASAFSGNTFTRMGANPTNSCIGVFGVTHKFSLSIDGNGFGELGSGATPSGPYINIESNPLVRISEGGNTYQNATYAPDFSGVMADCEQTRPIAMGYISAAGAVEGHSVNVASVTKIAAGQYKINLAGPVAGRKFALTQPGSARVTYNLSFDATSVTVGFTNLAGVDTDTEFGFVAYATEKR